MIIKSLTRKGGSGGTEQLLKYLLEHEHKVSNDKHSPLILKHNLRSRSINGYIKEFQANEQHRLHQRKNSISVYHTIISFSNLDKQHITPTLLKDIQKQFISLRGENNIFLSVAHIDKDHIHLHVVYPGTQYLTGISNRQSRKEFQNLKVQLTEYQKLKYPELSNSLPNHTKGHIKDTGAIKNIKTRERESNKLVVVQALDTVYKQSTSKNDFLNRLQGLGYEPYSRGGKVTGIKTKDDVKYRLGRLGYDDDRFEKLEQQVTTAKTELSEIQSIRDNKEQNRNHPLKDNNQLRDELERE